LNWQFCTLDQAKALKDLGITQKSLFYWNAPKSSVHMEAPNYGWTSNAVASAFNASELIILHRGGMMYFSATDPFCARRLASDLISDIRKGIVVPNIINKRLDLLFADNFRAFDDNQKVVQKVTNNQAII
jgi:hypothetical protein